MPGADDERARDPSRREFFRTFSRDAVRNVGAAVGPDICGITTSVNSKWMGPGWLAQVASALSTSSVSKTVNPPEASAIRTIDRTPASSSISKIVSVPEEESSAAFTGGVSEGLSLTAGR